MSLFSSYLLALGLPIYCSSNRVYVFHLSLLKSTVIVPEAYAAVAGCGGRGCSLTPD